jgi:hypothetical protein
MTQVQAVSPRRLLLGAALAALVLTGLGVVGAEHHGEGPQQPRAALMAVAGPSLEQATVQEPEPRTDPEPRTEPELAVEPASAAVRRVPRLPGGGTRVFGRDRFLVAYYGTAGTGVLGVLGEAPPDQMHRRLRRAAQPFGLDGERVQPVYELIVTIADPVPGPGADFSHDIAADRVRDYIEAAHRHQALVVLDLQPGRADFLTVAKRWAWALRDPWVGLALDPEWRMGPRQVPGRVIGSVAAAEVNQVSGWLSDLVDREGLPEKPLVLHQFRASMIREIERVKDREGIALVQHADGFGTQAQKLATYRALARPGQFVMGFKLFYDEDVNRFTPREVRRIRPGVRFVSYQ